MSKQLYTVSKEGLEYLCGLIRELSNVSEGIDDINLRSDGTFSSVKIDTLLNNLETNCNEYTDRLVANLSRLELKIVTNEADINKPNILYLHKPDGATSYNQYVVIERNKVLLGTTDISMTDYYTITQADAKFALKTTTDTLTTEVTNIKSDFTTHKNDADIHVTTTDKAKWDKVTDKVDKTDIIDNLTSTDTDKPLSANQGKTLDNKKLNKSDANKIELINIDGVNIKDFILENCTEENKIYHIAGRSNCTELPKASTNYYIMVEKIGSFTIKLTAKELAGSNNEYVRTYRSDSDKWTSWEKVCTTSVADVPLTRIPTNKNTTNYEIVNNNGSSSYIVRDGICAVSLCIKCNSVSAGWIDCFNAMPRPYLSNGIHFSASNMYNTDAKPIFVKVIGNMLQVRQGSVTSGINNYYISFSYPVAEN